MDYYSGIGFKVWDRFKTAYFLREYKILGYRNYGVILVRQGYFEENG